MCFYHDDYDWLARLVEDDARAPAGTRAECYECRQVIHPGEPRRHVLMREYEACRVCDPDTRAECGWRDDDDWDGEAPLPPCPDGKHDLGERFECDICERCDKLLDAIRRVEEDEGCSGHETQPGFGELHEAMWESGGAVEYIERALKDTPELAMGGHLDRFYRLTREWEEEFEERWDWEDLRPVDEHGGEG